MLLYGREGSNHLVSDIMEMKENNVDIILATINGVNVCFTYVHPVNV